MRPLSIRTARTFGGWTSLAHPSITEIFCRGGFDFIGIDLEHSTISQEQAQRIIAACHAGGIRCLPRIATHNPEVVKVLLDSGADGLIAPSVSSIEQVERLAEWIKYPPGGRRSYGIARAQGYGFDFERYTAEWNEVCTLVIQIESIEGVQAADSLLEHPVVDAALIGPYDLSGSLGLPGQLEAPAVVEATRTVIEACRRYGKGCGTHLARPSAESIEAHLRAGYSFLVLGSDVFALWRWTEQVGRLVARQRQNEPLPHDGAEPESRS